MTSISQHCATCRCQELMAKQDLTGRTWEKYDPAIDKRVQRSPEHAYWGHGDCATWIRVPDDKQPSGVGWSRCKEPAAWRRSKNGRGVTYLCQQHAREGGLPREVPRFATLEEAEAWLEAHS